MEVDWIAEAMSTTELDMVVYVSVIQLLEEVVCRKD